MYLKNLKEFFYKNSILFLEIPPEEMIKNVIKIHVPKCSMHHY